MQSNQYSKPQKSDIFIITGTPGVGKSTVAVHLMERYDFGFHIPIDDLREWVVSGVAHPLPVWTDEAARQFDLGYRAAVNLASIYAGAGFAVAIDQVIYPADVNKYFIEPLAEFSLHKIFLHPGLETALARNAARTNKDFETSFLHEPIKAMYRAVEEAVLADSGWIIIDSANLSISQTVDEILSHIA